MRVIDMKNPIQEDLDYIRDTYVIRRRLVYTTEGDGIFKFHEPTGYIRASEYFKGEVKADELAKENK